MDDWIQLWVVDETSKLVVSGCNHFWGASGETGEDKGGFLFADRLFLEL